MATMSIAYGGVLAFLFRVLNAVIAFAIVVLVERASDFGAFGLGITVIGIVTALTGGMTASVAYQISNQGRVAGRVLLSGMAPMVTLSALAIVAGLVGGSVLSGDAGAAARPVAFAGAAIMLNSVVTGVFLGRGAFVRYNVALVAPPLFSLISIAFVFFVLNERTASGALASYAAGQWLAFAAAFVYGHRQLTTSIAFDPRLSIAMVTFGATGALSSVVSFLGYRGDQFVVAGFEGKEGVGVYLLAVVVAESVWQVSGSLALATYARVGAATRQEAAELTARVMRHTILLLVIACSVLFLAADLIATLVFSNSAIATPLRLLVPGVLVYSLASSLAGFYTYQRGLPWVSAVIASVALGTNIGLAFVFVPIMGVKGAALAKTLGYTAAIVPSLLVFMRQEGIRPAQILRVSRADLEDYRTLLLRLRGLLRPSPQAAPLR